MSPLVPWTSFDPEMETPSGSFSLAGEGAGMPLVVLLAGEEEEATGWAPRAALGLVRGWTTEGHRIVLADLGFDAPALHALLGEENGEGVVDMVLYGASVQRVARRPGSERFILISAGTPVHDASRVLLHPRWATLIAGFREAGAILVLYIPSSLTGSDALASLADVRVQLGGEGGREAEERDPAHFRIRPAHAPPPQMDDEAGAGEEPFPADGEVSPGPAVTPARTPRLAPAPVPREVPLPRLRPVAFPAVAEVLTGEEMEEEAPSGAVDPGPPEPEEGLTEEAAFLDARQPETLAWEGMEPWDFPEVPGPSAPEEGTTTGDVGDSGLLLDPAEWGEDDIDVSLEPLAGAGGPRVEMDEVVSLPGDSPGEMNPSQILEGDIDLSALLGEQGGESPPEEPEDDLRDVHPDLDRQVPEATPVDPDHDPRAGLEEDMERLSPDSEGSDPFGFLGSWGEEGEGAPAQEPGTPESPAPGQGGAPDDAWGDPVPPWDGPSRPWNRPPASWDDPEPLEPLQGREAPDQEPPLVSPGDGEPHFVAAPTPAPRPARPTAPREQRSAAGAWILLVLLLLVAAALGAARFGYIDIPGVTPPEGGSVPSSGIGATTTAEAATPGSEALAVAEPTADMEVQPSSGAGVEPPPPVSVTPPAVLAPAHALALTLTAFGSATGARTAADRLQGSLPGHPVVVAPVESGGRLFHRLMVGGAPDREAVEALRALVAPLYTGSNPSEWIVRDADRAFLLGESASVGEARQRMEDLRGRGIPAYVLEVPLGDGARLWRVLAGAYGSDAEATALAGILREAGEASPSLIPLAGRPPG